MDTMITKTAANKINELLEKGAAFEEARGKVVQAIERGDEGFDFGPGTAYVLDAAKSMSWLDFQVSMAPSPAPLDPVRDNLDKAARNLQQSIDLAIERGLDMLTKARQGQGLDHLGHNLGNVATELAELSARKMQTVAIRNDLDRS